MASEWYDYRELKNTTYKLWKEGEWDKLSPEIKRLYWNELQRLLGEANADMEIGGSDEISWYSTQSENNDRKKNNKKGKKRNYLRAYSIEQAMENGIDCQNAFTPEDQVIQQEINQKIYASINELDEKDSEIISLYYLEGLKERQIGKILGISQKTVNNRRHKSLKKMRENLKKTL